MSLFHLANDGSTLSIMSVDSGYTLERTLDILPKEIQDELKKHFGCKDLCKPAWTRTGLVLSTTSPLYLWFLYEKAEEIYNQNKVAEWELEDSSVYYQAPAMQVYAESFC